MSGAHNDFQISITKKVKAEEIIPNLSLPFPDLGFLPEPPVPAARQSRHSLRPTLPRRQTPRRPGKRVLKDCIDPVFQCSIRRSIRPISSPIEPLPRYSSVWPDQNAR
jgi:hypothetical protein